MAKEASGEGVGDIAEAFRRAKAGSGEEALSSDKVRELRPETAAPGLPRPEERPADPASLPETRDGDWPSRAVWVEKEGPVAEAFRHLALCVQGELAKRNASSLLVVSCDRGEGRTLTACNLALALASVSAGERVALLEVDLRRPSLARRLAIEPKAGFEQVLAGEASLEACWTPTEVEGLDIFPVKRRVAKPHELLARPNLVRSLRQLERSYSVVVCDGPPALPVPDVRMIAPHVGVYLPVVRAGVTSRAGFAELSQMLPTGRVLGAFLNCARTARHARRYYEDEESAEEGA